MSKKKIKPLKCPRCGTEIKVVIKFAYCQKCGNVFPVPERKRKK